MSDLFFFFRCLVGHSDFNIFEYVKFKDFNYSIRNSECEVGQVDIVCNVIMQLFITVIIIVLCLSNSRGMLGQKIVWE